jgi:cholesterol transport system auxiliary component
MKTHRLAMSVSIVAAVATTACGTGAHKPRSYYLLDAVPAASAAPTMRPVAAPTLLVEPTTSEGFYEAQAIVYSRSPGTRAYYQLNSWTEPPGRRLGALLIQRLDRGGAFAAVAPATAGVSGTFVLSTHLEEIYHDASISPGQARIVLTAELSDPARRSNPAQRRFTASAPVATADAEGAVQAFDVVLGPLLDEIADWAGQAARSSTAP